MKLHKITLRNLNSLYGAHSVDLDVDLGGATLFLIRGPTGAGKSTLMDAVSLALFGVTPRLAKASMAQRDERTIVSRGARSSLAEVEFSKLEEGSRVRYRARWSCRRSSAARGNNLQRPERSLERLESDGTATVLVSDARNNVWQPVFAEILEDFSVTDFQRSMLLAQGQFDAFLRASARDRAEILERLTDTGLYRVLGQRAAQLRRAHQDRLRALEGQRGGVMLLGAEAREARETRAASLVRHRAQLARDRALLQERAEWLGTLYTQREEASEASTQVQAISAQQAEHGDELEALRRHQETEPAAQILARLQTSKVRLEQLRAHLEEARVQLTEEEASAAVTRKALDHTRISSETETRRYARVDTAHDAWALAEEAERTARNELGQAEARVTSTSREHAAAHREQTVARAEGHAAREALGVLQRALEEHGADDALVAASAELQGRIRLALEARERSTRRREALSARQQDLQARGDRAQARQHQLEARRDQALAPLVEAANAAEKRLFDVLDGEMHAEVGERRHREAAQRDLEEATALEAYLGASKRTSEAAAALELRRRRLGEREAELEQRQAAMEALKETTDRRRELQEQAETARDRMVRIAALLDHRRDLVHGEPCPLCGATTHPQAARLDDEVLAGLEAAQRHWAESRDAAARADGLLQEARVAAAAAEANVRAARTEHQTAKILLSQLQQGAAEARRLTRLAPKTPDSEARRRVKTLRAAARSCLEVADHLAGLEGARSRAAHDLAEGRRSFESQLESVHEEVATVRVELRGNLQDQEDLIETARGEAERQHQLTAALRDHDVEGEPDTWLDQVTARTRAHQDRRTARDAARRRLTELASAQREAEARTNHAAEGLEAARDQVAARQLVAQRTASRQHAALEAVRAAWGDPSPESAPDVMTAARTLLDAADTALATARTRHEESERRLAARQGEVRSLTQQTASTADEVASDREALTEALRELGLVDTQALLSLRLTEAEAARLTALDRQLRQLRTAALARLQDREQRLQSHHSARPEGLSEDLPAEVLASWVAAHDVELTRADDDLRAVQLELEVDNTHRSRLETLEIRIAAAAEEAGPWLKLHELIGRGEGEAFKTFAQALNLGRLVREANGHLAKLAPRYRLSVARDEDDLPTLDFLVTDRWQQDSVRAPETLSGGESFLVSLALALGLSDLRTVRMPIETLLLDEGLGTLDPETLDTALAALQQLQSGGRQVGIISHVAGLQDRIDARIVVRPLGGGRSEVITELG